MSCENIKTNILSFLAAELSSDEHKEILHHIEGCTPCRMEMEEL
ncbi:anti-sigma factor family protein, partial [Candidatus Desulfatibia sp.]